MHSFLATVAAKKKECCDVDSLLTAFSDSGLIIPRLGAPQTHLMTFVVWADIYAGFLPHLLNKAF